LELGEQQDSSIYSGKRKDNSRGKRKQSLPALLGKETIILRSRFLGKDFVPPEKIQGKGFSAP
jgi:hypothetical protein